MQDPDKRAGRDEAEHGGGGLAQQLEEEGRRRDSGLRQRHTVRGIFQTKYFPIYTRNEVFVEKVQHFEEKFMS